MKKELALLLSLVLLIACSATKNMGGGTYGSPNVAQQLLDDNTFVITKYATDKTYGYTEKNPVMVGSKDSGPKNERRFLNALVGPEGQELSYYRLGSCCGFSTANGLYANSGMLDMYNVSYEGLEKPLVIYINMYDSDTLKAPVGLKIKNTALAEKN